MRPVRKKIRFDEEMEKIRIYEIITALLLSGAVISINYDLLKNIENDM